MTHLATDLTAPKYEGVYIDDLIIGFASRGEIVTGALPGDTTFATVPSIPGAPTQILAACTSCKSARRTAMVHQRRRPYQHRPVFRCQRSVCAVISTAPAASQIYDGQTFTIDDG